MDKNTINKLAYDLTYQRYLLNKDKANYLFNVLKIRHIWKSLVKNLIFQYQRCLMLLPI